MNERLSSVTIGVIALLVGAAASAATTSGRIVSADATTNAITIRTDDEKQFLFSCNDATKIEQQGASVALGDLRKDSRVTVTSEQAPEDPRIPLLATRVQVDEMALAAPVPAGTARVESAGTDGGVPIHTAQVSSADYDEAATPARRSNATPPLPLIAVLVAGAIATGIVFMMRRRHQ